MKISCIIATYNGVNHLPEQLDSIRNQTIQPDEVIIRDDKSTDDTVSYLNEYINTHNLNTWNVRVNNVNLGHRLNFTTLLKEATGDIIFLCDQDDVWFTHKIETYINIMKHDPSIKLLASNITPIYTTDEAKAVKTTPIKNQGETRPLAFSSNWVRPNLPGCSYAIRKKLVDDYLKIWTIDDAHDAILWSVAYVQEALAIHPESTMYFKRHDSNASDYGKNDASYRIKSIESDISVMERCISRLKLKPQTQTYIRKQIGVYRERVRILRNRQVIPQLVNIKNIKYYARPRFWLADLIYLIKS